MSYFFASKILYNDLQKFVPLHVNKIIDIACGDDNTIGKFAKNASLCVANDISRQSIYKLKKKNHSGNIIYTNHNLLELDYRTEFDVLICKNVMHHMRNVNEIELMMEVLKKFGRRIILIDVENPRKNLLARMWNNYYVHFLNDHGGLFISFSQFKDIINTFFNNKQIVKIDKIFTIKGYYMIAIIDQ